MIAEGRRGSRAIRRLLLGALLGASGGAACESSYWGTLPGGPEPAPRPIAGPLRPLAPEDLPSGRSELRFGLAPTLGGTATEAQFRPVAEWLSRALGATVRLVVTESYETLIEAVVRKEVDLALVAPLSLVLAREQSPGILPLVSTISNGRTSYSGYFVVRKGSPFQAIEDLRGKRVAFVDRRSTSGWLLPRDALRRAGLDPDRDLGRVLFAGSHDAALLLLVRGEADAAAIATGVVDLTTRLGDLEVPGGAADLRILAKSGEVRYDAVTSTGTLGSAAVEKIRAAFLSMNAANPEAAATLEETLTIDGWAPVTNADYDDIARIHAAGNGADGP